MQYTHILGIDIAKTSMDVALSKNKANVPTNNKQFSNNLNGYKALSV